MSAPQVHPAALPDESLLKECDERHVRRSGPGGQHRNKVESGVVLAHRPTGLRAEASERRRQGENKAVALSRLRRLLALEVRSVTVPEGPSPLWASRSRGGRIAVNEEHADYPVLLAEALDHLATADWDIGAAAGRLGVTASQLVKVLKDEPRALAKLNAERAARGLSPLR